MAVAGLEQIRNADVNCVLFVKADLATGMTEELAMTDFTPSSTGVGACGSMAQDVSRRVMVWHRRAC